MRLVMYSITLRFDLGMGNLYTHTKKNKLKSYTAKTIKENHGENKIQHVLFTIQV